MSGHIRAASYGAVAGATIGASMRGRKGFRKLNFFEPIPVRMAQSESLEAWLVSSRHARGEKSAQTISQSILANWNYPIDESAFGLANASKGLSSPIAGSFANPLPRGSQAIGRAIYWGIAFNGKPDAAAEYAYYDATLDHTGDGVWGPVALARLMAIAHPGQSVSTLVRALTASLPKESKIIHAIPLILQSLSSPDGEREIRETLASKLGIADPLDAALTVSWVLLGLLRGNGDFEKSLLITAGCGGASNHSGLACGAIAAALTGDVPEPWIKPLGKSFITGHGLRDIDPPKTLTDFIGLIVHDAEQFSAPFEVPVVEPAEESAEESTDTDASDEQAVVEKQEVSYEPSEELMTLLTHEPNESITEIETLRLSAQYIDPPIVRPGKQLRMAFTFTNIGEEAITLKTALKGPEGWEVGSKLGDFLLEPGMSNTFAAIARPPKDHHSTYDNLSLKVNKYSLLIPIFGSQLWYHVGPFVNHEGTGFNREYPAQENIKLGEVFNGRSDLPIEWTADYFPGVVFDVEPLFKTGPGTAYLYAKAKFEKPGRYKIVASSGVGVIVWINGEKILWYHDTHSPVPRPTDPYIADFTADGEFELLIKTFRNRQSIPPLSVYFLAEDGTLATPIEFLPI